jgi:hypothetical protein
MLEVGMGGNLRMCLAETPCKYWAGKRKKLEILGLGVMGHWVLMELRKIEFL